MAISVMVGADGWWLMRCSGRCEWGERSARAVTPDKAGRQGGRARTVRIAIVRGLLSLPAEMAMRQAITIVGGSLPRPHPTAEATVLTTPNPGRMSDSTTRKSHPLAPQ